eukprot:453618-Rhodomonas_salina.1
MHHAASASLAIIAYGVSALASLLAEAFLSSTPRPILSRTSRVQEHARGGGGCLPAEEAHTLQPRSVRVRTASIGGIEAVERSSLGNAVDGGLSLEERMKRKIGEGQRGLNGGADWGRT